MEKFRSEKERQTVCLNKKSWSYKNNHYSITSGNLSKIRSVMWRKKDGSEKQLVSPPAEMPRDYLISKSNTGRYSVITSEPLKVRQRPDGDSSKIRIASLDPGVRTFMTVYSPEGKAWEW
jgi:hypothetical protein